MDGEWRTVSFAELVGGPQNVIGGPFGSNLTSADYTKSGVPVVRGSNMVFGRVLGGEYAYVSPEKANALSSNQIAAGDIVVTQRGTLGQIAIAPSHPATRYVVSQSQMGVHVTTADPQFVYYLLTSGAFAEYLAGATIQTGVPHINLGLLRNWQVSVPGEKTQARIAGLLGALDDKIELNERIAATLEAQAQALFKSWFVDFDPVRAKADGRPTCLPNDLADLFPDHLANDGLPDGWRLGSISDLAHVNPRTPLRVDQAPYIDMAALPTSGPQVQNLKRRTPGSGARFRNADTLIARITPCLENGKTALVDCLDEGEVGCGSTEFIVLRPKQDTPEAFPYLLSRFGPFREMLIAGMTGTSGRQRVQADVVNRWPLALPPPIVLAAFGAVVGACFDRIRSASLQSRTLAELRDTLLPKLISGELHIRDAEAAFGAAA